MACVICISRALFQINPIIKSEQYLVIVTELLWSLAPSFVRLISVSDTTTVVQSKLAPSKFKKCLSALFPYSELCS